MYWTEQTYRIHGYTPDEIEPGSAEHINRSMECYHPQDRPVILAAFQRCVEEGQPYDLELPFTTANGRKLWIRTTAQPIFMGKKIIRVIGTMIDITEQKEAANSIRTIEEKNRVLFELSPDAHFVAEIREDSRDLIIVNCNQAALDLLGMTRDTLIRADIFSLSPEHQPDGLLSREKAKELIDRCLSDGSIRFDWLHSQANGVPLPVEITMFVYREQGKTFLYSIWRDLSGLTHTAPLENNDQEEINR